MRGGSAEPPDIDLHATPIRHNSASMRGGSAEPPDLYRCRQAPIAVKLQ